MKKRGIKLSLRNLLLGFALLLLAAILFNAAMTGFSVLEGEENLQIMGAPSISSVVLNTTSGFNWSSDNITAYPLGLDNAPNLVYDWRKESISDAVLNMPFNINGSMESYTNVKDYSTWGNNGTLGNGSINLRPLWNSSCDAFAGSGGCYQFDGLNDYIVFSNSASINLTGDMAISAWIKPAMLGATQIIMTKRYASDTNVPYQFSVTSSNYARLTLANGSASGYAHTATSTTAVQTGVWYHVVGTVKGTAISLYLNGILEGEDTFVGTRQYNTRAAYISKYGSGDSSYFNGSIDHVQIWNRSLSAAEIASLYNNGRPQYNVTHSDATNTGDTWYAAVTPNNGTQEGAMVLSNNLTLYSKIDIAIEYPENTILFNTTQLLNATLQGDLNYTWYLLDGTTESQLMANASNLTLYLTNLSLGIHNVTVYANDSLGRVTSLIRHFAVSNASPVSNCTWLNESWHYRLPVTIGSKTDSLTDGIVSLAFNSTYLLNQVGVPRGELDENSIRIVEYGSDGAILGEKASRINYTGGFAVVDDMEVISEWSSGGDEATILPTSSYVKDGNYAMNISFIGNASEDGSTYNYAQAMNNWDGTRNWTGYDAIGAWVYPKTSDASVIYFSYQWWDDGLAANQGQHSIVPANTWTYVVMDIANQTKGAAAQFSIQVATGELDNDHVDFIIDEIRLFNHKNAVVEWVMNGTTPAFSQRYYNLYFDIKEHGTKSVSSQGGLPAYNSAQTDATLGVTEWNGGKEFAYIFANNTDYLLWGGTGTQKIFQNQTPPNLAAGSMNISAARNEYEAFQVSVKPKNSTARWLTMEFSNLTHSSGRFAISSNDFRFYPIYYVNVTYDFVNENTVNEWWPDPLSRDNGTNANCTNNYPFWIEVKVPSDAPAGDYTGNVSIVVGNSSNTTLSLNLHVWNFTLTNATHLKTNFQIWDIANDSWDARDDSTIWNETLQLLADHRMTAAVQGYKFLAVTDNGDNTVTLSTGSFDSMITYMVDVLGFNALRGWYAQDKRASHSDATGFKGYDFLTPEFNATWMDFISKMSAHLKEKGWYNISYFYLWDEPLDSDYPNVTKAASLVRQADPDVKIAVSESIVTPLIGYIDMWQIPQALPYFNGVKAQTRQAAGDSIWVYNPGHPTPDYMIDTGAMKQRLEAWWLKRYNVEGVFIWAISRWIDDPWYNPTETGYSNGAGYMLYPGSHNESTPPGPTPSLRFKLYRESIEDYEYLWLLEQKIAALRTENTNSQFDADITNAEQLLNLSDLIQSPMTFKEDIYEMTMKKNQIARTIEYFDCLDTAEPLVSLSLSSSSINANDVITLTCTASDTNDSSPATSIVVQKPDGTSIGTGEQFAGTSIAGTYTVTCTATDAAGNSATTSAAFTVSLLEIPLLGGSSSTAKAIVATVSPNSPLRFDLGDKTAISSITITANKVLSDVKFEVREIEEAEVGQPLQQRVYRYLEIQTQNARDEDIDKAIISFDVDKLWVNNSDPSNVVLMRYENGWQEVKTSMVNEDEGKYYYESVTSGLSIYAIAYKESVKEAGAKEENDAIAEGEEEPKHVERPETQNDSMLMKTMPGIIALVLLIISIAAYLIVQKRRRLAQG